MKPRTIFATLPEQDRQLILNLCSNHDYDQVVLMLEKPRSEGGLAITTSKSALCRFFTTAHPEPSCAVLAQYATALQVRHEQDGNIFLGAIRAFVEARVFEALKSGKALADMEKDFKILKIAQNLYFADLQWRTKNPEAARVAYNAHVERCAQAPEIDFVPNEELENKQSPDGMSSGDLSSESDGEYDLRDEQEIERLIEAHDRAILARQAAAASREAINPATQTSKSPVIPQIPLDSTSMQGTGIQFNPKIMGI